MPTSSSYSSNQPTSSSSTCPVCSPPTCSNTESLSLFKRQIYNGDFYLTGVGTRDTGHGTIHLGGVPYGASITEAYLYWNVLVSNCVSGVNSILFGPGNIGSCSSGILTGSCVGFSGNPCWTAHPNAGRTDGGTPPQNIFCQVYKATVTGIVTGNGPYCVDALPYTDEGTACNGANQPAYPGCAGSEGVVLLVIWQWNVGYGPTGPCNCREVSIYEGAALIADPTQTPVWGGVTTYTINHSTAYYSNVNLAFGLGDAQTYTDQATFNGNILPGSGDGSDFANANEGNLLWAEMLPVGTGLPTNVISITSTHLECLCYFLMVFSGTSCPCQVRTQIVTIGNGAGFTVNNGLAVSLGTQNVSAVVTVDSCDCLPSSSSLYLVINGGLPVIPPSGGITVNFGDTIDVRVNNKNCDICTANPVACAGATSSSSSGS